MAYQKFINEQQLRQSQKQLQNSIRRKHDPLPEPPSKKPVNVEDEINRRRSLSERQTGSPKLFQRMSEGTLDESEINPYAVYQRGNQIPAYSSIEDVKSTSQARESSGSDELKPYATSTPTALFLSLQRGGGITSGTPQNNEVWQKRENKTEELYAQVDLSRKRSFRKSKELTTMNDSEVNLIENSLYANANLLQQQKTARETPTAAVHDTPPPLPKRNYNLSEDFPPADSGTDTLRSNDDEGYNTFKNEDRREENHYSTVDDISPRPSSIAVEDPYALRVKEKINFFNNKVAIPTQDVWVKMNARQKDIHTSVPDLNRKGSEVEAPLAQQEVCHGDLM